MGTGVEVVVDMHAEQSQEGCWHVGRCRSTCLVRGEDTDDTRSHLCPDAQLWRCGMAMVLWNDEAVYFMSAL